VTSVTATDLIVRPYREGDEDEVLALLSAALGEGPVGQRSRGFFRWKHFANPFGRSFMLVAEIEGKMVGLRALMRWEFHVRDDLFRAVRAVDTATHPDYQGVGVFSRLTREALTGLNGGADLVFNTPNDKSLPGYLKMGWRVVGKLPIRVRVRNPLRFTTRILPRSAPSSNGDRAGPPVAAETAVEALRDVEGLSLLLSEGETKGVRLSTPRTVDYLRWRYASAPLLDYRAVRVEHGGRLRGLAIFRVRPRKRLWETTIAELLVPTNDASTARQLLRTVSRVASVDHLTCHFPLGSTAAGAARRNGFVRAPGGLTLVVNPLRPGLIPRPDEKHSWALSLGDLEVF
jgi:GNAT superfamily N-acetyltransferase